MEITAPAEATLDLFDRHQRQLSSLSGQVKDLLLILRNDIEVANRFAAAFPVAVVHVLDVRSRQPDHENLSLVPEVIHLPAPRLQDRIDYLARISRPQVILESGNRRRAHKLANLRELFYFLPPGGHYLIDELQVCGDPRFDDRKAENVLEAIARAVTVAAMSPRAAREYPHHIRELAASLRTAHFAGHTAALHKSTWHYFKLRDREADEVLRIRYGSEWGETLIDQPARPFVSRAEVVSHGKGPISPDRRTYQVPPQRLRRYHDVLCPSLGIAIHGDYVLPESFRHMHARVLGHKHLIYASPHMARSKPAFTPLEPRRLPGCFYLIDTEYPGHFGHVTTEVLSRVWGWREAVRRDPSVRPLLSVHNAEIPMYGFQRAIFDALDIALDDAEIINPHDAVLAETVYASTQQFENPHYVDPKIADTWQQLQMGLGVRDLADSPRRIFVSRRPEAKRRCHQRLELERFFAKHGFHVFYPDLLPFAEQARLFAGAEVIAGFAGSGMFTMLLAPRARVILITGDGYNAENELLIAGVNGNELHYFWGKSDVQPDAEHTQLDAARSDYSFDLRRHRRALRRLLD